MYSDLSTHHDWCVKKAIVDLAIMLKGDSKRTSGNSLSPLGARNKDNSAALQTLLTGRVRLHVRHRLAIILKRIRNGGIYFLMASSILAFDP